MERLGLPATPWIVGHRGAAGEELENTLASVLLAIDQGADMVEIDIQLTADGELALFHDWSLERLAGRPEIVEDTALADLRRIPLPAAKSKEHRILDLDELLSKIPETVTLNVELKRRGAEPKRFTSRLLASIRGRHRILVSSFDWELLATIRSLDPGLALAPLARENRTALARAGDRLGAVSLHAHRRIATAYLTRLARRAARPVLAYTVNEATEARHLLSLGIAGLFTDYPGKMRRHLDREQETELVASSP